MKVQKLPLRITVANNFVQRLRGLMFKKTIAENEGLLITPCNSIHMFFMKFAIDAVFLDKHHCIVELKEHVKPWSIIPPVKSAHATLELPAGTIKKMNLQIGDIVQF